MGFAVATIEQRKRAKQRSVRYFGACMLAGALCFGAPGCSAKRGDRVETREVTTIEDTSRARMGDDTTVYRSEEKTEETAKDTSSNSDCSGVLTCGFHAIGEVLAFPFKAVGYLVQAIF